MYKYELTKEEVTMLTGALDVVVRQGGLNAAGSCLNLATKLNAPLLKETENGNKDFPGDDKLNRQDT